MLYIHGATNQINWLWAIERVEMKLSLIEAEANCFGGLSPPSSKQGAEREQTVKKS
jgi:hypothetical protein